MFSVVSPVIIIPIFLGVLFFILLVCLYYYGSDAQSSFEGFASLPELGDNDRILVFSPHPDDETAAVGGVIYSAREKGALVRVVMATDGNQLGLGKLRYRELTNSLNQLKVPLDQLKCLGYPDTKLSRCQSSLRMDISQEINMFKPTVIICPDPADLHPDHRILAQTVLSTDTPQQIYTYLIHFFWWPQMLMLTSQNHLLPPRSLAFKRHWVCFPLTVTAYRAKSEALSIYKTQLLNLFIRPKLLRLMQNNELFALYR